MKLLALERDVPGIPESAFTDGLLRREAAHVWELYQSGVVREIYFRADRHTAIIVLECVNVDEARNFLATLPLVERQLVDFDIVPLRPYPGFERLFDDLQGTQAGRSRRNSKD